MHVWDSLNENCAIKLQSIEKRMPQLTAAERSLFAPAKRHYKGKPCSEWEHLCQLLSPDPRSLFTCSLESCSNLMGSLSQCDDKPYFLCHLKLRHSSVAGKKIKEAEEKNKSSQQGIWIWNKMGSNWQKLTGIKGPMASIVTALRGTCDTRGL